LQPKISSLPVVLFRLLPNTLLLAVAQEAAKPMLVVAVEVDSELRQIFH